jgi:hypothetical protein
MILVGSLVLLITNGTAQAIAQSARDAFNIFNNMMRAAIAENARSEWTKTPHAELVCLEQYLQQRGTSIRSLIEQGITPTDPRLSSLRIACKPEQQAFPRQLAALPPRSAEGRPETERISARPTFDCFKARTPTARILCLDPEGARADWDLSSAYWAQLFSLPENVRDRFKRTHEEWFPVLSRSCKLTMDQSTFSPIQRQCVLNAFRRRAGSYRSQLTGDALLLSLG